MAGAEVTRDEIRWWIAAVALGAAAAGLGAWSDRRGRDLNPSFAHAMLRPGDFDGARLWVPAAAAVAPDTIESQGVRIRVVNADLTPGTIVSISATFRADGPRLDVDAVRVIESREPLIVYAVSVAVVAAVLWLLSRHLRLSDAPPISPRSPWPTC